MTFHLGFLKREFKDGLICENMIKNLDKTHIVVNIDNGKTLGLIKDRQVKYDETYWR